MSESRDKNQAVQIAQEAAEYFGHRLVGVLWYGSTAMGADGSDLDLLVVLDRPVAGDAERLREISSRGTKRCDFQLLYRNEIGDGELFSLDGHGCFFVQILRKSKCLFGTNPFLELTPPPRQSAVDILHKVQCYTFRARQSATGHAAPHKDTNPDLHRKKLRFMMLDILLLDDPDVDFCDAEEKFLKRYPSATPLPNSPLDIAEALPHYEELYAIAQRSVGRRLTDLDRRPERSMLDGLSFESLTTTGETASHGTVIICDGIPAAPCRRELMNDLAAGGWNVVLPRYRGTWESSGAFLEDDPARDIIRLAESVAADEAKTPSGQPLSGPITLLGSSFGGWVAARAASCSAVSRAVLVSPMIEPTQIRAELESLRLYLTDNLPGSYRFDGRNWKNLYDGSSFRNGAVPFADRKKLFVIVAGADSRLSAEETESNCRKYGLEFETLPEQDHLSLSRLKGNVLECVVRRLTD